MVIESISELREVIAYEKNLYKIRPFDYFTNAPKVDIFRYVKLLRKCEFYKNRAVKMGGVYVAIFSLLRIRKNALGKRLGIEIGEFACGRGLLIYHAGSIVINGESSIGDNLKLHGGNCIGNNGKDSACPNIGEGVEVGYGGVIIGNASLGNNIKVAANATVVKDCLIDGVTLVGTPAKVVSKIEIKDE